VKTLATYSIKGGVGKTTAAVNIAYEAARSGVRVLLWDLDPQGAATFFFRVKPFVSGGAKRREHSSRTSTPQIIRGWISCPQTSLFAISICTSTTPSDRPGASRDSWNHSRIGTTSPFSIVRPASR
jgi:cellulose biosynthesis protein BcsQ